jgi:hypothetical protein
MELEPGMGRMGLRQLRYFVSLPRNYTSAGPPPAGTWSSWP